MLTTTNQYKLNKSISKGWTTAGLNLAPANAAALATGRPRLGTVCAMAGACAKACLQYTGMNQMTTHAAVRVNRTVQLLDHWDETIATLIAEIRKLKSKHKKFAYRPNLLSDLPKLAHELASALPDVQFYDYTKIPRPWERTLPNYHLTFSYSERSSWAEVEDCLAHGINVAVVFNRRKGELPRKYRGIPVIDGDKHDLRFLDKPGRFVGLSFKGSRAKLPAAIESGFVLEA